MFIKKLTRQVICDPDNPVVKTPSGSLRGLIVDDTYIFRGIKYADAKRFEMPRRPAAWEGTKDAIIYGTVAPEMQTVMPHDNYNVPHVFYPQDEDCQYLNIWTQSITPGVKKPVMVWLHGGGFITGSGIEHFAYDGENMSRHGDIVVVTLNHRLNVLGYLDLSAYGEKYKYTGNLGMADIVAALEWVRDNIACFGGDPDNVTIFGQSGGGGKVSTLLNTPAANGLFHKAIIQSGITGGRKPTLPEKAKAFTDIVLSELGITAENIEEIETVKYYKLARAGLVANAEFTKGGERFVFGPVTDGDYFIGHPLEYGFSEHAKTIPIMIGSVLGEFENNYNVTIGDGRKNEWSDVLSRGYIRDKYGDKTEAVETAFRAAYPEKKIADVLFMDTRERLGCLELADLRAKTGGVQLYNYLFALEAEFLGGILPWHNAEIPYAFHNADYIEPSYIPGVTERLQDIMCTAWTSFARTGDPNGVGVPLWKPYTGDCHATMVFDRDSMMKVDYDKELLDLLPTTTGSSRSRRMVAKLFGGGPRV